MAALVLMTWRRGWQPFEIHDLRFGKFSKLILRAVSSLKFLHRCTSSLVIQPLMSICRLTFLSVPSAHELHGVELYILQLVVIAIVLVAAWALRL